MWQMKSGESHCTHELASDVWREEEKEEEEQKDVMTSKNLTALTLQVGNNIATETMAHSNHLFP